MTRARVNQDATRYALRLPIAIEFEDDGRELVTETLELSAHEARFRLDAAPAPGRAFQFTLTFPP
jgi:hypothetical protein